MIATSDDTYTPKRDLHIGGLGTKSAADPSIRTDDFDEEAESLAHRAREAVNQADDFVRARPWQAIGVVALLSLAAGLLIARRF